jgi:hypothetical protein
MGHRGYGGLNGKRQTDQGACRPQNRPPSALDCLGDKPLSSGETPLDFVD